jgi:hypothetical protein
MTPRMRRAADVPDRATVVRRLALIAVPLLLALASWQTLPLVPSAISGLDDSWQAALQMAHHYHVAFGSHLVFTYGPLGFLSVPTLWYGQLGALAVFYAVVVRIALAAALFTGARRSYGTAPALLVALLISSIVPGEVGANLASFESVPFFILVVWGVDRVSSERSVTTLSAIAGALAGLELLNKVSTGVEFAALAVVLACAARGPRLRHLAVVLSTLLIALIAGWLLSGQDIAALPAYVRGSAQIISGYSAALSYEQPMLGWQYAAAWIAFGFGLAAAWQMTNDGGARRRWGTVVMWIVFCFLEFKEGFVRHDVFHAPLYFIALLGGFVAFTWSAGRRTLGLTMAVALFALALAAESTSLSSVLHPVGDFNSAFHQAEQVLNSSDSNAITAEGRAAVQAAYPLDAGTLRLVEGHSVAVEPDQADVAWAYQLAWRPLPVFQSYAAYTTTLDRRDADDLNSAYAPQRILRNLDPGIDGRLQPFDEPLTTRAILCRYQQLRATSVWQVLAREHNRCGAPVLIRRVRAEWGQPVSVPPPANDHSLVLATVEGVQVGGVERLTGLLYKPAQRVVLLNGYAYRLVEGTADDGLLLRAPAGADYPPPFNLAPDATTIAFQKAGGGASSGDPITVSFFSESIDGRGS